ncbi:MAG: sigma-70 family RNA polymerase sigma factor [Clostridiales bacterium]|nr:sigma-70 family RNA polymerase sigma factor [Clostridiales bacterium]
MEVVMNPASSCQEQLDFLITQYEKDLIGMCYAYLRDISLAEDAAQETFIKAYKNMNAFRGDSSVKTWLMRIAINECKRIRKNAWYRYVDRHVSIDQVCLTTPLRPPSIEDIQLTSEIMSLPRRQMEVILLHYYQEMDVQEISVALAITTQAVYLRLKKARAKLKHAIEGGIDDE